MTLELAKISSFARLKPLGAAINKEGGVTSSKLIRGWDANAGIVELGEQKFDHFSAVVGPDTAQIDVYKVVAQPLVQRSYPFLSPFFPSLSLVSLSLLSLTLTLLSHSFS